MGILTAGIIGGSLGSAGGGSSLSGFAGVTILEGLSGIIDIDAPNGGITITVSGQVIQLNALFTPASGALISQLPRKFASNFTSLSGTEFVLYHGLGTTDFVFNVWSTTTTPQMIMVPENVYASGINHAVIVLDTPTAGRIVLIG